VFLFFILLYITLYYSIKAYVYPLGRKRENGISETMKNETKRILSQKIRIEGKMIKVLSHNGKPEGRRSDTTAVRPC